MLVTWLRAQVGEREGDVRERSRAAESEGGEDGGGGEGRARRQETGTACAGTMVLHDCCSIGSSLIPVIFSSAHPRITPPPTERSVARVPEHDPRLRAEN